MNTPLPATCELPFGERTQPLPRLTAAAVAETIRGHLAGSITRAALSEWAMAQFVKQDSAHWFEPTQARALFEAIATLIPIEEADAARERESLARLAHRLEAV